MKRITLLARVYGQYRNRLQQTLKSDIQQMMRELDVQLKRFDIDKKGHIILDIAGSDYEFFRNVLQQEFGTTPEIHEILLFSSKGDFISKIVNTPQIVPSSSHESNSSMVYYLDDDANLCYWDVSTYSE